MARLLVYFGILLVVLQSCIPKPGHPLEWLHREDAIIVQLRLSGGDSMTWSTDREGMPSFTLYGDGTVIVSQGTSDCGTSERNPCSVMMLQSRLPDEDIQALLDFIDGIGFFNFKYEQPVPPVSGAPTTYLYVSTKLAANAVRASALGWQGQDEVEWREFRKLATIRDRIVALQQSAHATSSPFVPQQGMLAAVPRVATDLIGVPEWPYPSIPLPSGAQENDVRQVSLSAEQVASLGLEHPESTMCWQQVQYASRLYDVCYRPVLPFEENFPEFETP